jgi:hypothetical protein
MKRSFLPTDYCRKLKPRQQLLDGLWMDFSQYWEFDISSDRNFSLILSYSAKHSWWSIKTQIFEIFLLFIPSVLVCTQFGFPCPVLSLHDLTKPRTFVISMDDGDSKKLTSDGLAISPFHNRSDFHSTASK